MLHSVSHTNVTYGKALCGNSKLLWQHTRKSLYVVCCAMFVVVSGFESSTSQILYYSINTHISVFALCCLTLINSLTLLAWRQYNGSQHGSRRLLKKKKKQQFWNVRCHAECHSTLLQSVMHLLIHRCQWLHCATNWSLFITLYRLIF